MLVSLKTGIMYFNMSLPHKCNFVTVDKLLKEFMFSLVVHTHYEIYIL